MMSKTKTIDHKIVEIPTGIISKMSSRLEGPIKISADGYLKAKWIEFEKCFKPLEK